MKVNSLYIIFFFLTPLFLFSGCKEELDDLEADFNIESSDVMEGDVLRIQVSDAGYRDEKLTSRVIDNGLKTFFQAGDSIGLFVVNSENEMLYANVPYTLGSDGIWSAEQNVRTKGYPVRVFAYYPYVPNEQIIEKVDTTAEDISTFLQSYIEDLDITDQSTEKRYRQADIMGCMVKIEKREAAYTPLKLSMNHLMGLIIINLPKTVTLTSAVFYLKGDTYHTWTVRNMEYPANLINKSVTVSNMHQILDMGTNYRYICNPNARVSFSGRFTVFSTQKEYSVDDDPISFGACRTYNLSITPFALSKTEYTPQVGDFYMEDGSILPDVSDENKDKCLGVVFSTKDATSSDMILRKEYPKCNHGLVVSVKFQSRGRWQWNNYSVQGWASSQTFYESDGYLSLGSRNNIQGYNNTKILHAFNQSSYGSTNNIEVIDDFDRMIEDVVLPSGRTSELYLPSPQECVELYRGGDIVNANLEKVGSIDLGDRSLYTSAELGTTLTYTVRRGVLETLNKSASSTGICIIAVFAF